MVLHLLELVLMKYDGLPFYHHNRFPLHSSFLNVPFYNY